ncbi:MAG: hypothetical protein JKY31_06700 [Rhodobacteraceae bacterium]|nr:hypothetical protein [Paracoccaceae bacterium]
MAKLDKAELKKQGLVLKETIAQARKKTLNFALLQGKDQMYLVTHLKRNTAMLRKEAKAAGGGPKAAMGTLNVEGKNLIFSVEEEPPGPFPKLTKKHFMTRGIAVRVTFKLPNGKVVDDGEPAEDALQSAPPPVDEPAEGSEQSDVDEGYGASIMNIFSNLKSDLDQKLAQAGDDAKSMFQDMSDKFNELHSAEKFDEAAAHLEVLKKQVADFMATPTSAPQMPEGMQNKINEIIARGLKAADIIEKNFDENVRQLTDNINAGIDGAGEFLTGLAKPITDKIEEIRAEQARLEAELKAKEAAIEAGIKAAKEQLKDMDLSEAQADGLARLSLEHPKSFEAALQALKTMDTKYGDLVTTPEGIAKIAKDLADAKALASAERKKFNALDDKEAAALLELFNAEVAEKEAREAVAKVSAALVVLKAKLPSDLPTLTPPQRAALAKVADMLQAKKAIYDAAVVVSKEKDVLHIAADTAASDQSIILGQVEATVAPVEELSAAIALKKQMLDSVEVGALSPNAPNPMSDEDVAKILAAVNADPRLGKTALDLLEASKDKGNIAKGAGMLVDGMANEFKDKAGVPYGDDRKRALYARKALQMGAAMGGSYFDDMKGFIDDGGLNQSVPADIESGYSVKKLEQSRAKFVGNAMIGADGVVDTSSQQAKDALATMNFHPGVIRRGMPEMNRHFAKMAETMQDPAHKQKIQDVMDGISTAPTETTGQSLVALSVGKSPRDLTADDTKSAVMSAMFTPLNQGPVGSCFATGPARSLRNKNPAKAMQGMAEIATTGIFTTEQNQPIRAVSVNAGTSEADKKANKLPLNDNMLMRSWEYTIATAGAQLANSYEQRQLKTQLWSTDSSADPDGKNLNALGTIIPADKWPEVKVKLQAEIKAQLVFRYNATSDIKGSADGSSTQGNFEIYYKDGGKTITDKAEFIDVITKLALKAAEVEADSEIGRKIVAHCKSTAFIDSVCLWEKGTGGNKDKIRPPWKLPGGGLDAPMVKVLEGGNPSTVNIVSDNPDFSFLGFGRKSQGERTTMVMAALLTNFESQTPETDMVSISTSGIHTFGGLPNHPSLDKLKEGDDLAAALKKHLLDPGEALAKKEMDARTVSSLFDRQIDAIGQQYLFHNGPQVREETAGYALIVTAQAMRPTEPMIPKKLKGLIDKALAPIEAYISTAGADKWKKDQIAGGVTPSTEDYKKELEKAKEAAKKVMDDMFSNNAINTLGSPEFVIADTNWGDGRSHIYFVIIPDPVTGEPKMFQRSEPDGKLSALPDNWLDTNWTVTQ